MPKLGGRHFSYSKKGIAAYKMVKKKVVAGFKAGKRKAGKKSRYVESVYNRLGKLLTEKDWIQGAVNPAHKGYCTPMTKSTCTPRRKAFAKRAKKGFN